VCQSHTGRLTGLWFLLNRPKGWILMNEWMWSTNPNKSVSYTSSSLRNLKVNAKCALVQALRLCTECTAHRGSRDIALLFHDHGTRRGWGVSFKPCPSFTPGKGPVPIVQEIGLAPGPAWTAAENLASTGIRSPDRPARSQSLYRLRYPAHCKICNITMYHRLKTSYFIIF
jgi:hypothetical protein